MLFFKRLTLTSRTPDCLPKTFSMRAEQAEQLMPVMSKRSLRMGHILFWNLTQVRSPVIISIVTRDLLIKNVLFGKQVPKWVLRGGQIRIWKKSSL